MDGINPRRKPAPPPATPKLTTPPPVSAAPPAPATPVTPPPVPQPAGLALPHKKSRKRLWFIAVPVVFVVLCIIAALSTLAWYNDALQARATSGDPIAIEIQTGASIDQVASELEQKKIIKSALAFSLYMKLNNKDSIKTGSYLFAPTQPVAEIVSWLNDGRVSTRKVTILPGKTLKEIREGLIKDGGYTAEAVDAALKKQYDHPLLAEKPAEASLEGYIFPETYFVTIGSSPEELLVRTFDEFEARIKDQNLRAQLQNRGFNLYEGITLASIVAKEVTKKEDQYQVAQVFETRLAAGMMLGSDVTYHYAADQLGVERAVNIDSPYNTRIHTGLPPGPIGNFNVQALQAVAEPAAGDYLYFVAGDDGVTHFSRTFEEHQENIQKYCQKLCAQA